MTTSFAAWAEKTIAGLIINIYAGVQKQGLFRISWFTLAASSGVFATRFWQEWLFRRTCGEAVLRYIAFSGPIAS